MLTQLLSSPLAPRPLPPAPLRPPPPPPQPPAPPPAGSCRPGTPGLAPPGTARRRRGRGGAAQERRTSRPPAEAGAAAKHARRRSSGRRRGSSRRHTRHGAGRNARPRGHRRHWAVDCLLREVLAAQEEVRVLFDPSRRVRLSGERRGPPTQVRTVRLMAAQRRVCRLRRRGRWGALTVGMSRLISATAAESAAVSSSCGLRSSIA